MKRNKPRGREWGPSHRRLDFPFVYISIFAFKRLIELFIRIIVLIIKLSAKLSSRSSLAFLKALVECRWAQLVIVIACVVSISPPFLLLDLAVGEWPRQWFWGCSDSNTFSTRAQKLLSTDSEDTIEGEGEGNFLRISFGVYCVFK